MTKTALQADRRQSRVWRPFICIAIFLAISCQNRSQTFGDKQPSKPHAKNFAFEQNARLGRGINILGYDPIWKSDGKPRFKELYFKRIRDAGFDHVRINIHPFRDAEADGRLSRHFWKTLDWVIEQSLKNGLAVVLDFHEYLEMAKEPAAWKQRWLDDWKQIAERYHDAPDNVYFELLNEPNGQLTPRLWNDYLREALEVVRQSNPNRTVIIGPGRWNSIDLLDELDLPKDDRNLIVTVHYYNPFQFTHQGTPWTIHKDVSGIVWEGIDQERRDVQRDFDRAQTWATKHERPLYLGEFGAYNKADLQSRVRYLDCVARQAEQRGWSWAHWQFDSDFTLYDTAEEQWVQPLLDALMPPGKNQNFQASPP